jgi:tetraacyldisaccharide 4'-kinase
VAGKETFFGAGSAFLPVGVSSDRDARHTVPGVTRKKGNTSSRNAEHSGLNEQAYRNLVSGRTAGLTAALARSGLLILSFAYRGIIGMRNAMFDAGLRTIRRTSVPVISVGNLTTGGTGKTPIVALVVHELQQSGRSPAIISRGYRSVDGQANDEKLVLERLCPGVPHEQGASRDRAAQILIARDSIDVIVMDDGFQHRQFSRNLDIVLIDATNPFGYGHLLPRGLLREPLSSLRRADCVLITRADMVSDEQVNQIEQKVRQAAPQLADRIDRVTFNPTGLIDGTGQRFPLSQFTGKPVLLISGIGNPDAFEATCLRSGLQIAGTLWFPDHHHFAVKDLHRIIEHREHLKAVCVVTTLKDLVKLPNTDDFLALEITANFEDESHAASFQKQLLAVAEMA